MKTILRKISYYFFFFFLLAYVLEGETPQFKILKAQSLYT